MVLAQRGCWGKVLAKRISSPSFCGVCSNNPRYTIIEWFGVEGTLKDHLDPIWPVLQGITTTVPCSDES